MNIDNIEKKPESLRVEESLKTIWRPKLTPLGNIHSLVRSHPGGGADGEHPGNDHGS